MKKRLFAVLLLLCLAAMMFAGNNLIPAAQAEPITTTRTLSSQSYDGYIVAGGSSYDAVSNATTGTVTDTAQISILGQYFVGGYYEVLRGFVMFGTSILPDDANITSAVLSLYISQNVSNTDFNVTIQSGQPNYPNIPLVSSDYAKSKYSGNGGSRNTTEITALNYWNITLNSSGLTWIQKASNTKLCLRNSREISGTAPTDYEYITFYTSEKGEAYAPILYVTYETEGYRYLVHGPYWESGAVATTTVNVTLSIENTDPYSFMLNGTSGTADLENITIEQRGIAFTWNFSSYSNYTRTYFLTSATFEEIWLYIPNTVTESVNLYTFTVTDFVGITNAFLETVHSVGGQNRIVERQSLDVINSVPFWLVWAKRYDIRLVCDQGTHNWGSFVAGAEMSQNLIVVEGMFPTTYPGLNVTCKAKRMNATWIQANYTDNMNLTSWVQVVIQYKKGYSWTTAYSTNNTGNTQQINWYSAESTKNYVVKVTACRDSETKTWSFGSPKPKVDVNPFAGLFEGLGTSWPFPPENLIGLFLVLAVFAVFSYANMPLGCILGCIMAGFLNLIGWLNISWNFVALGFCVGIFAAISRAKREEREI